MARKEDGTVYFDDDEQALVDKAIQERIARVKSEKPEDYEDLREIVSDLETFGYTGTPAEKKAAIKAYKDQLKQQQEAEKLAKMEEEEGLTPAQAKRFKDLEDKLEKSTKIIDEFAGESKAKKAADEAKKKADEEWSVQVEEFSSKYSEINLDALAQDAKFVKFASKRTGTLLEKYEDYSELIGETATETLSKALTKELRSTSGGKGNNQEAHGLTKSQKETVDDWNRKNPRLQMSYKEFADKL